MDPASLVGIASGAVALGEILAKSVLKLAQFISNNNAVPDIVQNLHDEADGLQAALATLGSTIKKPEILMSRQLLSNHQDVWKLLENSIERCQAITGRLDQGLRHVGSLPKGSGVLRRAAVQMKLSMKEEEIKELRSQSQVQKLNIQMCLQLLTFASATTSPAAIQDLLQPRFDKLMHLLVDVHQMLMQSNITKEVVATETKQDMEDSQKLMVAVRHTISTAGSVGDSVQNEDVVSVVFDRFATNNPATARKVQSWINDVDSEFSDVQPPVLPSLNGIGMLSGEENVDKEFEDVPEQVIVEDDTQNNNVKAERVSVSAPSTQPNINGTGTGFGEHIKLTDSYDILENSALAEEIRPVEQAVSTSNFASSSKPDSRFRSKINTLVQCGYLDESTASEYSAGRYPSATDERIGRLSVALFRACDIGDSPSAKILIGLGADARYKPPNTDISTLMVASSKSMPDVVSLLLQGGARVNESIERPGVRRHLVAEESYRTLSSGTQKSRPLSFASAAGQFENVEVLLRFHAEVNFDCGGLLLSPLILAALCNHSRTVTCLLQAGAVPIVTRAPSDGSPSSDEQLNVAHVAASCGHVNVLAALEEHLSNAQDIFAEQHSLLSYVSASSTKLGPVKITALHVAVYANVNSMEAVKYIADSIMPADTIDYSGRTILHHEVCRFRDGSPYRHGGCDNILSLGVSPNVRDYDGNTALHELFSMSIGSEAQLASAVLIYHAIMRHGGDLTLRNKAGFTPWASRLALYPKQGRISSTLNDRFTALLKNASQSS